MPGGTHKKKAAKHCGKKHKANRSQSVKHKKECNENEEVKEILQSSEDSEKAEEDTQTTTNAESLTEESESTTEILKSNEDEPTSEPPLPSHVDHNNEHVKELNTQVEQLTTKVEQLAKQVEQLTAQAEQLVTEVAKYKARCSELEDELRSVSLAKKQDQEEAQNQLKLLNQKFTTSNTKLCETRNQCQHLKQELKLFHKALANEVGDNVSVQEIVSGTSNWRGRAQQILMLQQKVSELQNQLQETNAKEPSSPSVSETSVAKNKSAQNLKQLEKERRAMQENLAKELQEKTTEVEEIQKKLEALRARNKVLEGEVVNLKSTVNTLLEKGRHDDQLVSALTIEIKRLESKLKDYQESEKFAGSQWDDEREKHKKELAQEKAKSSQMQTIIKQKDEELRQLEEKLAHVKEHDIFSSCCPEEETDSHLLNDLKHDLKHDLKQDLKQELKEDLKQESSCAEIKDTEYYQKSYLAAEGECTRLLELIAVYNKRLDEQRHRADEAEDKLRCERQKSARLETKVDQLELEKSSAFKTTYSFRTSKQHSQKATTIPEEVQNRLELLQEENLTLQTRLKRLKQEKCEDLKKFAKVLSTRQQHFSVPKKTEGEDIKINVKK